MKIRFTFEVEINEKHPLFAAGEITPEWQAAMMETVREFVESVRAHVENEPLVQSCTVNERRIE